jgi:hypothetical protein
MSLAIDVDDIGEVLLPDGRWHVVAARRAAPGESEEHVVSTVVMDAYEVLWWGSAERKANSERPLDHYQPADCATGISFVDQCCDFTTVCVPMTSVLGVRRLYAPDDEPEYTWMDRTPAGKAVPTRAEHDDLERLG